MYLVLIKEDANDQSQKLKGMQNVASRRSLI
jgi:hypothetical protein